MRWSTLVALFVVSLATQARADDETEKSTYRIVVDRVEHEPSTVGGNRMRVFISALSLQGGPLLELEGSAFKVNAGSELKVPYALGRFTGTDTHTAIVVVVQATVQYQDVLPVIADNLDTQTLSALDEGKTQLAVLPYGETLASAKLASLKTARSKLAQVQNDGTASDPLLLDTVERALSLLKKAKTEPEGRPMRKMIILIGDGRDLSNDRDRVTRIGTRANKEGVRIHSFAFAPNDIRKPLLLLGELSKRSFGTFRWIRSAKSESWAPAFRHLRDEITQQHVLTYFIDSDVDLTNKKVKATVTGVASLNDVKVPEASCAGVTCSAGQYCTGTVCVKPKAAGGRGVLGWILLVGGILVGLVAVLWVIGFIMSKRKPPVPMDPDAIIAAAQAKAMGSKPPKPASIPPQAVVSQPPMAPAVAAPMVAGPRFYIVNGPRAGEQIALKHGFLIGKQPGCDLLIDDGFTSSQHAQIGMDHFGNCRVYDRGSTNGTFVNGQRITEYALEHGMSLRIGSTELRFLAQ